MNSLSNNLSTFQLKSDIHVLRKLWHLITGIGGLTFYHVSGIEQREMAFGLFVFSMMAFALETIRLRSQNINRVAWKFMGPFMRESEKMSYSGLPFYALGVCLSLFLFEERVAVLSIMFLVFADPISSYFGIKFGKDKIWGNKSLQGTLAGFITCYFLTFFYGLSYDQGGPALLAFSLLAGLIGCATELFSTTVDDNLTIPVVSGMGLTFLNLFFHIL